MQPDEEIVDDMPIDFSTNGQGHGNTGGGLLERDCALVPDRDYATARDLVNVVIAYFSGKIGEEEDRDDPNAALIERYRAEVREYARQRAGLHLLNSEATRRAIGGYREIISDLS
jgi:hypothetical protein